MSPSLNLNLLRLILIKDARHREISSLVALVRARAHARAYTFKVTVQRTSRRRKCLLRGCKELTNKLNTVSRHATTSYLHTCRARARARSTEGPTTRHVHTCTRGGMTGKRLHVKKGEGSGKHAGEAARGTREKHPLSRYRHGSRGENRGTLVHRERGREERELLPCAPDHVTPF